MYKPSEAVELRKHITAALHLAFKETMKHPIIFKVNSSNIMHTDLQPEGEVFTISFQVEIHKAEEKPNDVRGEP